MMVSTLSKGSNALRCIAANVIFVHKISYAMTSLLAVEDLEIPLLNTPSLPIKITEKIVAITDAMTWNCLQYLTMTSNF